MENDEKRVLLQNVVLQHDASLRRFLRSRLKNAVADVPDLMQEVFLRLIRVQNLESIRTPEAYLFSVAKSVLHQHRVRRSAEPEAVDISDALAEVEEQEIIGPERQVEAEQRVAELKRALARLPRRAYVTLILNRVVGMPLGEIAQRLGVSRPMAKKYLAKALSHCREHDREIG